MALLNITETNNFEVWLKAYNTIIDALNEQFGITLDGSDDYTAASLTIKNAFRDLMEASLGINKAGIFADPSTDHAYVGQFWDENPTFDSAVADDDLVYKHASDGKYYKADGTDENKTNVIGVCADSKTKVICSGLIDTGYTAIDANKKIYLSETVLGEITDTEATINVGISLGSGLLLLGTAGGSGGGGTSEFNVFNYTAIAAQTSFSGSDNNTNTLFYTADKVQVFVNGILLSPDEYTATTGNTIVFDAGLDADDNVDIFGFQDVATGISANQGNYTIAVDNNRTILNPSFVSGNMLVWFNGIKLVRGTDYDDTVSGRITLDSSIDTDIGDIIDFQIFTAKIQTFTSTITAMDDVESSYTGSAGQGVRVNSDGTGIEFGNGWYTVDNVNYSLETNPQPKIFIKATTQTFAITLPITPEDGTEIDFVDIGGDLETYNVTLGRSTRLIEGLAEDLVLDINDIKFKLVFVNTTIGWKILTL